MAKCLKFKAKYIGILRFYRYASVKYFNIRNLAPFFCLLALGVASLLPPQSFASTCEVLYSGVNRSVEKDGMFGRKMFNTSRRLSDYSQNLFPGNDKGFFAMLSSLPENGIWIDMGAGEGKALIEGLMKSEKTIQAIGISYRMPQKTLALKSALDPKLQSQFRYIDGAFVEDLWMQGRLNEFIGKADLITDVFGPFSYSKDLPHLLKTYLALLRQGGTLSLNVMIEKNNVKYWIQRGKTWTDSLA